MHTFLKLVNYSFKKFIYVTINLPYVLYLKVAPLSLLFIKNKCPILYES